ncbi:amine-terminal region of A TM vesicle-mediated sorter protein [Babesia caballi]|uniref:Amine-terminal region of A TM vesicle-mediated sorter protein n=1 Tax=Babesia caballi TaxID=5871 RepID=A0AAV4LT57_BABCB|nr:amine-terminal region of A TM vesicle-mediated sorter protein [Babesia caballi]
MIHRLVDQLVKAFGRELLEQWIPLERLNITSVTDPELTLTNVPLPDKLFDNPSIPFAVVKSNVKSVVVKCPWKAVLRSDGTVAPTVEARDVDVVLRFKTVSEWSAERVQGALVKTRERLLRKWNKVASSLRLLPRNKAPKGSRGVAMANSMEINIYNLKVVLVDNLLYREPFAITVEAERIRGVGMRPDDPSLSGEEQQGVSESLLSALWFTSSGLHVWLAIYHQEIEEARPQRAADGRSDNVFEHSDWAGEARGGRPAREETPSSCSTHSSDELFDDHPLEATHRPQADASSGGFWNCCASPCGAGGVDDGSELSLEKVKPEDEALMRILQGPYKNYNVTPAAGVTFDLVVKIWNIASLLVMPNAAQQNRRSILVSLRANDGDGEAYGAHAPCFDGSTLFEALDLTLTGAAAEILYSVVRYMQLASAYREAASGGINAVPDVAAVQRYVELTRTSQWAHREADAEFVKEFERRVPFHILLGAKQMANASASRTARVQQCFVSVQCCENSEGEEELEIAEQAPVPSYEWYRREALLRIMLPNVNVHLIAMGQSRDEGTVPSTTLQFSTFAFQTEALYKRATHRILACKPVVRSGLVHMSVRRRTFSAKVVLRPQRDAESLLCYPEELFANPYPFFGRYGSDDVNGCFSGAGEERQSTVSVVIEKYANDLKHVAVFVPKMVVVLNTLVRLNSFIGEDFWTMGFLTFEDFVQRNERCGRRNPDIVAMLAERMETVACRTVVRAEVAGVVVRALVRREPKLEEAVGADQEGGDKQSHAHSQQTVRDWFLMNDRALDSWEYCEDIEDPFAFKRTEPAPRGQSAQGWAAGVEKDVYSKEKFIAEMSAPGASGGAAPYLLPSGEHSSFGVRAALVAHLAKLRRWYRNTHRIKLPREYVEGLEKLHSLTVEVRSIRVDRESVSTLTSCSLESVALSCMDEGGEATQLVGLDRLLLIKRLNATCVNVEKVAMAVDSHLPVLTLLVRHARTLVVCLRRMQELANAAKKLVKFNQRYVARPVALTGSADICQMLSGDFYKGSPDRLEGCDPELVRALDKKLRGVEDGARLVLLCVDGLKVEVAAETGLYELRVCKTRVELQGRERVRLYIGNTAAAMHGEGTRRIILSGRPCDLGEDMDTTLEEMENGQIVLDYKGRESKSVNLEVRNVHHTIDMRFVKTIIQVVKQLKLPSPGSSPHREKNLSGHIMVHHSSVHHAGVGAMIDVYAVVGLEEAASIQHLTVEVPRFHATFTNGIAKRVFAVALLDVKLEMEKYRQAETLAATTPNANEDLGKGAKMINLSVALSHSAVWGFSPVPDGCELPDKFSDTQAAAENLRLLMHENWFNHMTTATLPSCYDAEPVVLVPLLCTRYAQAARLTPLLHQKWVRNWLVKASHAVDPHLCERGVEAVLEAFPVEAMRQRKRGSVEISVSALISECAVVAVGEVKLVALEAFAHRESVSSLVDLFSQCRQLTDGKQAAKQEKNTPKVLKVNLSVEEVYLTCPYNVRIDRGMAIPAALLPSVVEDLPAHKKRPRSTTSAFYIFRIYNAPRVFVDVGAEASLMLQKNVTLQVVKLLYNNMRNLQEFTRRSAFDFVDVMEDAKYQASLHLFDVNYNEGRGNVVSLACDGFKAAFYIAANRFDYWRDVARHVASGTTVGAPGFVKDFKKALDLDVANLSMDLCTASKSIYAAKLCVQHIRLSDAFGKHIIEDLYGSRCAMASMGCLDDATFCYPADQVTVSLSKLGDVVDVKVTLEHTRSEVQIDGISVVMGALQDLGLYNRSRKAGNRGKSKAKRPMKIEVNLALHEIWLYPSIPKDEEEGVGQRSARTLSVGSVDLSPTPQGDPKVAVPHVLKRAREIEYSRPAAEANPANEGGALYAESVIGCLISLSISSSKKGKSNVKLNYMGVSLATVSFMNNVKLLVDERNECILNSMEADERMLFEVRESCLKSRTLENGHLLVLFQATKPKISINLDQLLQLCLLKQSILETAVDTLKAHRAAKCRPAEGEEAAEVQVLESYDLIEDIKYIAAKYKLPMFDSSGVQGSVYNVSPDAEEANSLAKRARKKGSDIINKVFRCINKLIWHDDDRQLSASLALNDCKCILFSVKNEMVLTFNLQQLLFNLTHTAPLSKKRTLVDSSMVFNVTTYNSRLDYHDTVLQTTVVTLQVTYEDVAYELPALDVSMHVSGLSVEINLCLLQLFKQLKHVSSMLSSEHKGTKVIHTRTVKLYNELGLGVCLLGSKLEQRETADLVHLPTQRFACVADKEIYIFLKDKPAGGANQHVQSTLTGQFGALSGGGSHSAGSDWLLGEGKSLLFGNSNNVKSILHLVNGKGDTSDKERNVEAISKADRSLMYVGKYHMEQAGSRLFKVPHSGALILIEQFFESKDEPYAILSSSIRIQNSTDIPLRLHMDSRVGYLTKVAYKLTQHATPSEELEEMYLEPYSSSSVPLSWFGTAMMPLIAPVLPSVDATIDAVQFQDLHSLLNMRKISDMDSELGKEFVLRFRGFIALKCTVVAKEAASTDDCGSCLYHFTVKIEPMATMVNMLPCEIYVVATLDKTKLSEDVRIGSEENVLHAVSNYKVQARLKPGERLGIPFSEQKLFMRIHVIGTQLEAYTDSSKSAMKEFEYASPMFQVFLPTVGSVNIVKSLKLLKGSIDNLLQNDPEKHADVFQAFAGHLKSMAITVGLSRHDLRVWWPFMFENMSTSSLIINGRLLAPRVRFYGNLYDASNCRVRAIMYTQSAGEVGKGASYALSQLAKLDVTSTTDFRPPINLVISLQKRSIAHVSIAENPVNVDGVLESVVNASQLRHAKRYADRRSISQEVGSEVNEDEGETVGEASGDDEDEVSRPAEVDTAAGNNAFVCLGSTVRYAEYPFNMCKIVSVTNMYTFVNKLPFTVCVRGAPVNHSHVDMLSYDESSEVMILPGESGALNAPFQGAYIIKVENDICSGIFSLQYPRLPHLFQLELNSNNLVYSTVATRGLLVQVNVISGVFEGSHMPYSYNGYYFVLSLPSKPQFQILNLTGYTLAYTVPENMKTVEAQMVEDYETYEQTWDHTPMNKIGILPPTCITHYVPAANSKAQDALQVCLKVLHVDSCSWGIKQADIVREGYQVIKFAHQGSVFQLYSTIIIRANGTRIITVVDSKMAAIELNRMGGSSMSTGPRLRWSNISFSFLTPRITVTLSTKRKVILALHLTNTAIGISIAPSKSDIVENDSGGSSSSETTRSSIIEFDGVIQSIHIDHFVQGYIPVILKSSAKRSSLQESFLHIRVSLSNFMSLGLPVYELIQAKLSPLSINIEMGVIEQLFDSIENMLKMSIGNIATELNEWAGSNAVVLPQPKWVEMEPAPPVYIRKLTVEPITLSLAIRTSSLQLTHRTMRILDALPLDTPCVCVHFAREARVYLIELVLAPAYQAIIAKRLAFQFLRCIARLLQGHAAARGSPSANGGAVPEFLGGLCRGSWQWDHDAVVVHCGRHCAEPRAFPEYIPQNRRGDGWFKTSMGLALNLTRCAVSPIIGVVNMLITIVEGFSNVLLGDVEQFTHVYESDQLGNVAPTNSAAHVSKQPEAKEPSLSRNTFIRRMKTSMIMRKKNS